MDCVKAILTGLVVDSQYQSIVAKVDGPNQMFAYHVVLDRHVFTIPIALQEKVVVAHS